MPLYSYLGKEEVAEPWAVSLYKNHPLTGAPKNKHYWHQLKVYISTKRWTSITQPVPAVKGQFTLEVYTLM